MGIAQRLSGAHVLVTGVTGFVGEALLHRLLTQVPGIRVSVLVRARGSNSAEDRVRSVLGKKIFEGVDATNVHVVEGDMAAVPELPTDLTAVVHCAGDVSFDPPVDAAFRTNVIGTRDLLARLGPQVHYVHVSTAYVAGRRRGVVFEGPVDHDVDVAAELEWGLGQRADIERRSREADRLAGFRGPAERDHRRAGLITAAEAIEKQRVEWVGKELVRVGTERARALGWTDCYTFTKALGERLVEQRQGPTSIVRPTIIESALQVPYAGWIEGFKMAEPLILSYGRGELPEFPAGGDNTIDIVPVDHVVAATVAVLAHPPQGEETEYFHVSTGSRNPFNYHRFYACVRQYFGDHPLDGGERGAVRLPEWQFPGAQAVERLLSTGERAHRAANKMLGWAPRSDRVRTMADRLDREGRRLEFLRRYLDLYGEYVVADVHFDDSNTLALFRSLSDDDREAFAFDTAVVDWDDYMLEVHIPAVVAPIRRIDEVRRRRRATPPRMRDASSATGRAAAFFDLDGTLLSSNVVETYLWSRLPELTAADRAREVARVATKVPGFLLGERYGRETFLRAIYRNYAGARLETIEEIVDGTLTSHILARLAPAAVRRVREHRAAGQPTVLITGAIRPLTRPLAPLFDHIEAVDLEVDDRGICTGMLTASPLVGESRAAFVRAWARANDIDLAASFGYADSYSDLPLLAAVGRPVAVRPDVALFQHAKSHSWPVVDWASPTGAPRLVRTS